MRKFKLILPCLLMLLSPVAMASTIGGTMTKTYLHHLDRPGVVTCHQGQTPDNGKYATPTVVVINMAALSIPTQYQNFKEVRAYKQMGYPCQKLMAYIASFKNEFGTIPVTVTTEFSKQPKPDYRSYGVVNAKGENITQKQAKFLVTTEKTYFQIGKLDFQGFAHFKILIR